MLSFVSIGGCGDDIFSVVVVLPATIAESPGKGDDIAN
jgi:hypothetical protein